MIEIKLKSNNNPFYGMSNCLDIQNGKITENILNLAWNEAKDDKIKREMFFSLLFSVGDITARQHNIFKGKKVDSGGNANRDSFNTIFHWLWNNNKHQFTKFMNAQLFNEYQCFDRFHGLTISFCPSRILSLFKLFHFFRLATVTWCFAAI